MATKDEALKMAIEALEDADTIITQRCRVLLSYEAGAGISGW